MTGDPPVDIPPSAAPLGAADAPAGPNRAAASDEAAVAGNSDDGHSRSRGNRLVFRSLRDIGLSCAALGQTLRLGAPASVTAMPRLRGRLCAVNPGGGGCEISL